VVLCGHLCCRAQSCFSPSSGLVGGGWFFPFLPSLKINGNLTAPVPFSKEGIDLSCCSSPVHNEPKFSAENSFAFSQGGGLRALKRFTFSVCRVAPLSYDSTSQELGTLNFPPPRPLPEKPRCDGPYWRRFKAGVQRCSHHSLSRNLNGRRRDALCPPAL